jgi:hypothetical protein
MNDDDDEENGKKKRKSIIKAMVGAERKADGKSAGFVEETF